MAFDYGSIVSAAGSIVSGLTGAAATTGANQMSKEIAGQNRVWQSHENQLNRNWEEKMWNAQNLYNSPSAMMQRYKEAGLNPYLVQKDGSSAIGSASSSGTPSMVGAPSMPSISPANPWSGLGSLGSAVQLALQSKGVSANVAQQHADSLLKVSQALPELGKSLGWDVARKVALNELNLQGQSGSQYENLIDQQISSIKLQNQMQSIQNGIAQKYGERKAGLECANLEQGFTKMAAEIGKMASDTKVNESTVKLNSAKIRELASEFVRNHKEALLMAAQTDTLNQLRQYVVSKAMHEASILGMEDTTKRSFFNGSSGIREYLNYGEGSSTLKDAFILSAERNADEFWSLVMQLGNFNMSAGVHN